MSVNLRFDPAFASRVYAGSDIYLMPSKSSRAACRSSSRCTTARSVVASTGGLRDTVPPYNHENEEGRGFTFQSYNADDFLGAIDRAIGLYFGNRDKWNRLAQNDMRCDVSWRFRRRNISGSTTATL